jgi:pimeloyl-ACP methyl ester carboxylesterase
MPSLEQGRQDKSTNGRLIPAIAGLASRIAPDLTARWAERVFLTPGRREPRPAESRALATGHRFRVPFGGGHLAAWCWGEGPTVFLAHGWGSSAARMTSFVEPLVGRGFSVVAWDGPGHGRSDGTTSSIIELIAALRAVTEWTAAADAGAVHAGAIGHSIGGAAIALAGRQGIRFRRVVCIGTPSSLEAPSHEIMIRLGLSDDVRARMQRRIEGRFGITWSRLAVRHAVPDRPLPLLLIHDQGDLAVPVEESARIAEVWPGAELMLTQGLGHHRIVHDPQVVARATAFLAGVAAPNAGIPKSDNRHRNDLRLPEVSRAGAIASRRVSRGI